MNLSEASQQDVTQVYRFARLNRVFWALELSLVAMLLVQLAVGDSVMAGVLATLALVLTSVFLLMRWDKGGLASGILLICISLTISGLMWYNQGLRDEAMMAFPALIFFSAVIGGRRLFAVVVAIALVTVLVIGTSNSLGWHHNEVAPGGLESVAYLVVILLATSYAVWLFTSDLRDTLLQLNQEIARSRESEAREKELAQRDVLTDLPNRSAARERFEHAVAVGQRNGTRVGLMFLDLDDFKTINDSHGHQTGDEFLKQTALRLTGTIRVSDCVCRLGGDEFLIILESVKDSQQVAVVAQKILDAIKQPISLNNADLVVSASIGIAIAPDDGEDFDTICRQADLAMYHTKGTGRNNYHFFDQNMNRSLQERLRVLGHLHDAVNRDQFELFFQPKIDLRSGRVTGAESLIRWNHPELGQIKPADFIPIAEQSGLITEIGDWVIRESCRAGRRWLDMTDREFTIAVNISSIQFSRADLLPRIRGALQDSGLPPQNLELELTETLLIDNNDTIVESLEQLRALGVVLSIDDFGTGYSNLGYLKSFDVSVLKIDRSFISKLISSDHDRIIVEAIMQVASQLELKVVAEGVENREVADALCAMGCDMAQGYLWSEPLSASDFQLFLDAENAA